MKTIDALKLILRLQKRFERVANSFGATSKLRLKIMGACPAEAVKTNGKTYLYPEVILVKFENRSNSYFDFRIRDGRWVPEGTNLNTKTGSYSTYSVYRLMLKEAKAYGELCRPKPKSNILNFNK